MTVEELELLWTKAIDANLNGKIDGLRLNVLAKQTYDSIRRIEIYKAYKTKANKSVKNKEPFSHTSNPFILAQRSDLGMQDRLWILYLATYFGKSNKSGWTLFNRAAFKKDGSLIRFAEVKNDLDSYFQFLSSFDFFADCDYSNHRKFTAKKLIGPNGVFKSLEFFVNNIELFISENEKDFHEMYVLAKKIPGFGRLAGFDFTSTLVKCGLNVSEPNSMYANHSTGPLDGLKLLLKLTNNSTSSSSQIKLSADLMDWFLKNTKIFMTGQVLEDAICNWQKSTTNYKRYTG